MTDVLEQSDIDALLAAVSEPEPAVASKEEQSSEDMSVSTPNPVRKDITIYDFKRPERVSKDQMRALEGIHEAFARNFGATLSAFLRSIVEVKIIDTEQLTFSEFIHSLPNPTCFNLLSVKPWDGSICLEISPMIIFPIIDRLLGGASDDVFIPQRPLTTIEQRLVQRITDRALKLLTDAWLSLGVTGIDLTQSESNPHLVQVVAPNEVVVVITFELKLSGKSGTMCICVPFTTIEPVLDKLATQSWLSYRKKESSVNHGQKIAGNLKTATVNLRAFLAETTISMGQLMGLQVGDIIQTEKLAKNELIVQVEGKNKFAGRMGQFRGNRAIRITRPTTPDDRI
jgi:flagellar motor switch protein FliM